MNRPKDCGVDLDRLEQQHTIYGNPVTNREVRAVIAELRAWRAGVGWRMRPKGKG